MNKAKITTPSTETCQTCSLWTSATGACGYQPPPLVCKMFAMLHSEPHIMIDWEHEMKQPLVMRPDDHCSEWRPRLT